MFNYIKETIINDINNVDGGDGIVVVKRGGNYDCKNIVDATVYKTPGVAGTCAVLKVPFTAIAGNYDYYRYLIFIDTPAKELSDYAYANWAEFGKPIMVESAATSKNELVAAFALALPTDNPFYTVAAGSGATADLTFKESWMHVKEVLIYKHNKSTDEFEEVVSAATFASNRATYVTTENVPEFATGKWLVENLRFPSYPNVRYAALYSDEAPEKGAVYDQYSFLYRITHCVPGGLSAVSQLVDSVTTHVFYIKHADASDFEDVFDGVEFKEIDVTDSPIEHDEVTWEKKTVAEEAPTDPEG